MFISFTLYLIHLMSHAIYRYSFFFNFLTAHVWAEPVQRTVLGLCSFLLFSLLFLFSLDLAQYELHIRDHVQRGEARLVALVHGTITEHQELLKVPCDVRYTSWCVVHTICVSDALLSGWTVVLEVCVEGDLVQSVHLNLLGEYEVRHIAPSGPHVLESIRDFGISPRLLKAKVVAGVTNDLDLTRIKLVFKVIQTRHLGRGQASEAGNIGDD